MIIGASAVGGTRAFALLLWLGTQTTKTGMQPGIALVLLGSTVLAAGVALIVCVLRAQPAKEVGLQQAASTLRAGLDEVI